MNLPLDKLKGKNILITGATGLIGGCLVNMMMQLDSNCCIFASGRDRKRAERLFYKYKDDDRLQFIEYDVTKPLNSNISFHYIIHAASGANPNVYATDPVGVMTANFNGVNNLLQYGTTHHMERFLFVSSGEVYGEGDGRTFYEEYQGFVDISSPRACYPSSKRAAETLCAAYGKEYGTDYVIARPSHVYGPNFTANDNRVYAQFLRNILNGENIIMKSNGRQFRSWCFVEDCASALLFILLKGVSGEAYNIADDSSNISIRELAEMIADIGGRKVIIQMPNKAEKEGYNVVTKSVFSTEKLQALGWSLHGTMREKMEKTFCILKNIC